MENSLTILDYLYTNIKSPAIHALMSKWAHKFPLEDRYVADEFISLLRGNYKNYCKANADNFLRQRVRYSEVQFTEDQTVLSDLYLKLFFRQEYDSIIHGIEPLKVANILLTLQNIQEPIDFFTPEASLNTKNLRALLLFYSNFDQGNIKKSIEQKREDKIDFRNLNKRNLRDLVYNLACIFPETITTLDEDTLNVFYTAMLGKEYRKIIDGEDPVRVAEFTLSTPLENIQNALLNLENVEKNYTNFQNLVFLGDILGFYKDGRVKMEPYAKIDVFEWGELVNFLSQKEQYYRDLIYNCGNFLSFSRVSEVEEFYKIIENITPSQSRNFETILRVYPNKTLEGSEYLVKNFNENLNVTLFSLHIVRHSDKTVNDETFVQLMELFSNVRKKYPFYLVRPLLQKLTPHADYDPTQILNYRNLILSIENLEGKFGEFLIQYYENTDEFEDLFAMLERHSYTQSDIIENPSMITFLKKMKLYRNVEEVDQFLNLWLELEENSLASYSHQISLFLPEDKITLENLQSVCRLCKSLQSGLKEVSMLSSVIDHIEELFPRKDRDSEFLKAAIPFYKGMDDWDIWDISGYLKKIPEEERVLLVKQAGKHIGENMTVKERCHWLRIIDDQYPNYW
jgi:hypothetical protein